METNCRRDRIFDHPDVEVLKLVWRPGEATEAHDHGESEGLIRVIKGRVFQDIFDKRTKKLLDSTIHFEGDIIHETPDIIHIMGNPSKTMLAVTVNIYTPLLKMIKYDLAQAGESCDECQGNGFFIPRHVPFGVKNCGDCGGRGRKLIRPKN